METLAFVYVVRNFILPYYVKDFSGMSIIQSFSQPSSTVCCKFINERQAYKGYLCPVECWGDWLAQRWSARVYPVS